MQYIGVVERGRKEGGGEKEEEDVNKRTAVVTSLALFHT